MGRIEVELVGQDGNIFNIVGIVTREMKRNGLQKESEELNNRVFGAESYEDALRIMSEYVDIV